MATWDDIAKANTTIGTMGIERKNKETGKITVKEYAEVNQRVKAFRMVYPTGLIETEILSNDGDVCVIKATAGYYAEDGHFVKLATGTAFEVKTASNINRTSFIENCETSAIGRCIGFCGFGIDTSICSAEELKNALDAQERVAEPVKPIPAPQQPQASVPQIPGESWEDVEWRLRALARWGRQKLDMCSMNAFGKDFDHTPVALLKTKMSA